MKLAILTQPLGHNFGGLLQAYALQQVLQQLGHQVETLDRRAQPSWPLRLRLALRQLWAYARGRSPYATRAALYQAQNQQLLAFRAQQLRMSPLLKSSQALQAYLREQQFDAIVVGSDQVWRPRYSPHLPDYFVGFASTLPRISYAASFGVNAFDVPAQQRGQYAKWLAQFSAVSVRESSALALCREQLDYHQAQLVLDPTLLLDAADYQRLVDTVSSDRRPQAPFIASYLLDPHPAVQTLAERIATQSGQPLFAVMPAPGKALPSIPEWLATFSAAEYVITDSFHGCVFALLMHKKFIAIGNEDRGLDRFTTLLNLFSQQQRLISVSNANDCDTIYKKLNEDIDWDALELIRARHKHQALEFLQQAFAAATEQTTETPE